MDTMYRKKTRQEENVADQKASRKKKHVADGYDPKLRPREAHPDSVDSKKRIKGNLNQLNQSLAEQPAAVRERELQAMIAEEVEAEAGLEQKSRTLASPAPFAFILSLIALAGVFMYLIGLNVQVEEYSQSIDDMESRIAELKEEATRLEVQLESKYDLDEVERIATQEYGMVVSSTLPKKYISVSAQEDIWQESKAEEEEEGFFDRFISAVRTFLGKNEDKE